jgi:hypothetical protein
MGEARSKARISPTNTGSHSAIGSMGRSRPGAWNAAIRTQASRSGPLMEGTGVASLSSGPCIAAYGLVS